MKCSIAKPVTLEPFVNTLLELGVRVKTMSLTGTTMVRSLLLDHVTSRINEMDTRKGKENKKAN